MPLVLHFERSETLKTKMKKRVKCYNYLRRNDITIQYTHCIEVGWNTNIFMLYFISFLLTMVNIVEDDDDGR